MECKKNRSLLLMVAFVLAIAAFVPAAYAREVAEIFDAEAASGYVLNSALSNVVTGKSWYSNGVNDTGECRIVADPEGGANQAFKLNLITAGGIQKTLGTDKKLKASETVFALSGRIYPDSISGAGYAGVQLQNFYAASEALLKFSSAGITARNDNKATAEVGNATIATSFEQRWYDFSVLVDTIEQQHTIILDGITYGPYNYIVNILYTNPTVIVPRIGVYAAANTVAYFDDILFWSEEGETMNLVSSAPVNGAERVARDALVTLRFNRPIKPGSATAVSVFGGGHSITPTTVNVSGNTLKLAFDPSDIDYETEYTVDYSGVQNIFGAGANGSFSYTSAEPRSFEILRPTFYRLVLGETESVVTSLQAGLIQARATMQNNSDKLRNAAAVVVLRKDGAVIGIVNNELSVPGGSSTPFSAGFQVPNDGECQIELYIWDGILTMNALTDYYVFNANGGGFIKGNGGE
ncbi:MAG: Ig-like domain-containing protein [Firmicutes bacterium]|nr:Ig-like domain-containing protein [Bacillota bacterium]